MGMKKISLADLAKLNQNGMFTNEEYERHQAEQKKAAEEAKRKAEEAARMHAEELRKQIAAYREKTQAQYASRVSKLKEQDKALSLSTKSKAKAAGVKSAFVLNDQSVLMTAFGNGNHAIPEKYVTLDKIDTLPEEENYQVAFGVLKKTLNVRGRAGIEASISNPLTVPHEGMDQIHLKDKLENLIFGKVFQDNMHIQLAYNILDIDKILSLHVNNIIYTINNLLRTDNPETDDLIGTVSLATNWDNINQKGNSERLKQFEKLIQQPQLGYFGNVLWQNDSLKKIRKSNQSQDAKKEQIVKAKKEMERNAFALLSVLGEIRQSNAHGAVRTWTSIYCLDEGHDEAMTARAGKGERKERITARQQSRAALDTLYSSRINEVNEGFMQKANTDLQILLQALGAVTTEEQTQIACDYYDFIVLKTYKNLGFSIKKLREQIVLKTKDEQHDLKNEQYDSVRHKLYHLLDFIIFRYYVSNPIAQTVLVERLRCALNDAQKEAAYLMEADTVWEAIRKDVYSHILPSLDGNNLKMLQSKPVISIDRNRLDKISLNIKASYFSKAVYLLTRFLDAKEINDLLTTLISKFDNIASLMDVMSSESVQMPAVFKKEFELFSHSREIEKELRAINSFARMSEKSEEARGIMFEEAVTILGYRMSEESMKDYIKKMLDRTANLRDGTKENGFRNFIANNVIESDRFQYLVRYTNPGRVRELANNADVIRFVLKDIPDAQVLRYYNSCEGEDKKECSPEMREVLCRHITNMSFENFEHVKQNGITKEEKKDKERKKSIVRLYLTVMYLLVKNLVYVNSRYFLAFHCAERDAMLFNAKKYGELLFPGPRQDSDYLAFSRDYLDMYPHMTRPFKKLGEASRRPSRVQNILQNNIGSSDTWTVSAYRNKVEHLAAVRNAQMYISDVKKIDSYFSLYQYIMQRTIKDQFDYYCEHPREDGTLVISRETINPKMLEYFAMVEKYHTYCMDMTKALNVPFAYNLPRYKNLSIDGLFDRNRPGVPDAKDAKEKELE